MKPVTITLRHAELKTMVAKTPVEVEIILSRLVTAFPNLEPKKPGKGVVQCDGFSAYVEESLEEINAKIKNAYGAPNFLELTAVELKEMNKILLRESAIIGFFRSPISEYTNVMTIVGPFKALETPEELFTKRK